MMKRFLKILAACLAACMLFACAFGCAESGQEEPGGGPADPTYPEAPVLDSTTDYRTIDKAYMFGMGELTSDTMPGAGEPSITNEYAAKMSGAFGVTSQRVWMHHPNVLVRADDSDELTLNEAVCDEYHDYFALLEENGVERILVMNHQFILPYDYHSQDAQTMPDPWGGEYDFYARTLRIWENAYTLLAEEFPEITYWEVGNEFDMESGNFLHKAGWTGAGDGEHIFTQSEAAYITADLCWYANRGLKSVNPASVTVFPGASLNSQTATYFGLVYSTIGSKMVPTLEEFYDPDPDHYFQILAWHPYPNTRVDSVINQCNAVYRIVEENGDGDKKVWFTESGFSNQRYWGVTDDSDAYIAEMYPEFLDAVNELDYVESIFLFRLSNCYAYNNTDFERNFGLTYSPDDPVNKGAPKPAGLAVFSYFNGEEADPSPLYWYANGSVA